MTASPSLRELEELFHRAIALTQADRELFFDRACGNRPALRAQVERMIEAEARASAIFSNHPVGVGRWKLIEPIGAGGLGVVYRASCEADGVTLHAAVKILRPELDALLHERFIQERSMLARLDHPYIARMIDAGVGPCGTSFLAMEFVEGLPLDEYLEKTRVALKDRLGLFTKVCEAVAYLHDNRIVHGDLKPSNVMVRADGIPKLLDFGTARLIQGNQETRGLLTRSMMTPGYASPEQMAGLGPSVRGDVYSLGCVLREMFGRDRVCHDLAAIRDRCLAPSAEERYASPLEVAADVLRYLRHFPVRARTASSYGITLKFIRRNQIACGLAALVILSLLTGWAFSREYAAQRRSVVMRLVRNENVQISPESQQRSAYAAGVQDAAEQMERMRPPPLSDLTSAWRRVSYSQAARGQTPQSIGSIERSIRWGRQYLKSSDTVEARSQLAETLLYAALLHKRRRNMAEAARFALETIQHTDTLPQSSRAGMEKSPLFVRALPLAGYRLALAGDTAGGRALAMRAVALGRTMGKSVQFRAIIDAARFERSVKEEDRVRAWCAAARSLEVATALPARLCGGRADSAEADRESVLANEASVLEKRLLIDPERFGDRLRLARLNLQLARMAGAKGDLVRARERVEQARSLAADLLKADPENRRLHQVLAGIDRTAKFIRTSVPSLAGAESAPQCCRQVSQFRFRR
jgi:hypothetical protein